jgi:hypothetical protein
MNISSEYFADWFPLGDGRYGLVVDGDCILCKHLKLVLGVQRCDACRTNGTPPEGTVPPAEWTDGTGETLVDITVVEWEPHRYTERSARARLARRRKNGPALAMREHNGDWYTGELSTVRVHVTHVLPIEWNHSAERNHDHVAVTQDGDAVYWMPGDPLHHTIHRCNAADLIGRYLVIGETP